MRHPAAARLLSSTALAALPAALAAQGAPPAARSTGDPSRLIPLPQSSLIYARDGSTVIGEVGRQVRTSVALRTLPRYLPAAFVAVEDKRFYQHNGVDVVGIAGALKDAIGGDARGASTITQQLVGNMHPDAIDRRDRSGVAGVERKVREQQAALAMDRRYSKEQILEAYLNTIAFGHGWYGVDAAARHYFGKPAARVSLAEAASLAAMPKSPVLYDPSRYPERNRERRDLVLDLMAEQGYVSRAEAAAAKAEPVRVAGDDGVLGASRYFVRVVQAQAQRAGVPLAEGGYRVVTTLDPGLQVAAARALAEQAAALERGAGWRHQTLAQYQARKAAGQAGAPAYLQGAVVAMDPESGEVRALVGGRDYDDSPYNRAVEARRQPGSAFKPFVYAAAVAQGVPPNATVGDTAISVVLPNGRAYAPANSDGAFLGLVTMREALGRSRNPVAVQLWQQATPDSVIALARRAGVNAAIPPYPSSALGAATVRPIDFVGAYTVFATLGERPEARFVVRAQDASGRAVWSPPAAAPAAAMDPRVAYIVRDMLREPVERGTAASVRRYLPSRVPAAGKTGTTSDNVDVWFVGMTPDLVAGVWLGFDTPTTITRGAAGGTLAAPVWGQMMARWYQGRAVGDGWNAPPPPGVVTAELDRQTGLPADSTTPPARRYTEYFLDGTQPGAVPFDPITIFRAGAVAP